MTLILLYEKWGTCESLNYLKCIDLFVNILALFQRLFPLDDFGHALNESVHQCNLRLSQAIGVRNVPGATS